MRNVLFEWQLSATVAFSMVVDILPKILRLEDHAAAELKPRVTHNACSYLL